MHVTFNHGPYDGLEFNTAAASASLSKIAELPVSQKVLYALSAGEILTTEIPLRSVAVYDQTSPGIYVMSHLRPVRPEEVPGFNT